MVSRVRIFTFQTFQKYSFLLFWLIHVRKSFFSRDLVIGPNSPRQMQMTREAKRSIPLQAEKRRASEKRSYGARSLSRWASLTATIHHFHRKVLHSMYPIQPRSKVEHFQIFRRRPPHKNLAHLKPLGKQTFVGKSFYHLLEIFHFEQ